MDASVAGRQSLLLCEGEAKVETPEAVPPACKAAGRSARRASAGHCPTDT